MKKKYKTNIYVFFILSKAVCGKNVLFISNKMSITCTRAELLTYAGVVAHAILIKKHILKTDFSLQIFKYSPNQSDTCLLQLHIYPHNIFECMPG